MSGFALMPNVGHVPELTDVLARLSWYAAPYFADGAKLYLRDTVEMRAAINGSAPPVFSTHAQNLFSLLNAHVVWDQNPPSQVKIICWKMGSGGYSFDDKIIARDKHVLVDDWCDPDATVRWTRLLAESTQLEPSKTLPAPLYSPSAREVEVVGPGPSSQNQRLPSTNSKPIRMMILSAYVPKRDVHNDVPDVVVFSDQIETCGPSIASERTRDNLEAAAANGAWLVTHNILARAVSNMISENAQKRLVALQIDNSAPFGRPLSQTESRLSDTRNVLTTIAIPVAAELGQHIIFKGFDGALRADTSWGHLKPDHHDKSMNLRLAHPMVGLPDDYQANHLAKTAIALDFLFCHGWRLSTVCENGSLKPIDTRELTRLAPSCVKKPTTPLLVSLAHHLVCLLDSHELVAAALTSIVATICLIFISIGLSTVNTTLVFSAALGLLSGAILFGGLRLRRRQDRLANDLRRDLNRQVTDAMSILRQRMDQLDAFDQKVDKK